MSAQIGNAAPLSRTARATFGQASGASAWGVFLRRAMRVVGTRSQLMELDGHMLRDIGMTAQDAQREASRAPWDIEANGKPRR
jgi:uncharacterized protein YjiS (DUF1127 family)